MLFPLPDFPVVEYGFGVSLGAVCPTCQEGTLFDAEDKLRRCDHCFSAHPSVKRGIFEPNTIQEQGDRVDRYASLQHYAQVPVVGEPAVSISDFVLDIDRDDLADAVHAAQVAYQALTVLAPGQVRLYFSGKKGFHLQVPAQAFGFQPSELLGAAQRRIAQRLQDEFGVEVDATAYSRARLFRVVGSRHTGTGRFKVEISPAQLSDLSALKAYAEFPRPAVNTCEPSLSDAAHQWYLEAMQAEQDFRSQQQRFDDPPDVTGEDGFHPCIEKLLHVGPPAEGTRHRTYVTLATYLKDAGWSQAETTAKLIPWTRTHPTTHTDKTAQQRRFEMQADIRSVYRSSRMHFHCQYAMALHVCSASCPLYVPLEK